MMRLVISPSRRYHLGREQQGFRHAIIFTSTTSSQLKINWTFTWSLDKQLRKRNNEHKLPSSFLSPSSPPSCSSTTTAPTKMYARNRSIPVACFHHYYYNSSFSCSPMLPPHHILPSRRVTTYSSTTTTCTSSPLLSFSPETGALIQTKSSALSSSSAAASQHLSKLARIGGGHGRFQGKMSILNRRLHSSSWYASTRSLFPFQTLTVGAGDVQALSSLSPNNARFISTSASVAAAPTGNSEFFHISPQVRAALMENVPVVALESAIITHGMPFPDNIDTAFRLESIIRKHGVVPATVGVVHGRVTVGLTSKEIESLGEWAKRKDDRPLGKPVVKVSRRDIPFAIAHKLCGGTTVSGTIIAAVKAGISIFATGGLGGVHRGAESTFDISADLKELGRNPIGVVSAGVKSILDIGKTLEYMETEGICVAVLQKGKEQGEQQVNGGGGVGNGRDGEARDEQAGTVHGQIGTVKFPSFFTSESPFTAPYSVTSEIEAASLIHSVLQFQLNSGVLIAVPIPKEEEAATGKVIEDAIKCALETAGKSSVQGKDMTPFLLGEVNRLTGGLSLKANKHLIENNVRSACGIATHLAQLRREQQQQQQQQQQTQRTSLEYSSSHYSSGNGSSRYGGCRTTSGCNSNGGSGIGQRVSLENYQQNQPKDIISNSTVVSHSDGDGSRGSIMMETVGYAVPHPSTLENGVEKNSIDTTGGSSTELKQKNNSNRHKRPVIIGGTSLDLVLAIQENEIMARRGGDVGGSSYMNWS